MIKNGQSRKGLWAYIQGITYESGDIIFGLRSNNKYFLAAVRYDFIASGNFEKDLGNCGGYAGQENGATLAEFQSWLFNNNILKYFKFDGSTYGITSTLTPLPPLAPGLYDVRTNTGGPVGFICSNNYTILRVYQTTTGYLQELINFLLGTYYTRSVSLAGEYESWIEMTGSTAAASLRSLSQMIESAEASTAFLNEAIDNISDLYRYTKYPITEHYQEQSRMLDIFQTDQNDYEIGYLIDLAATIENEDNSWKKQWTLKILRTDAINTVYDEFGTVRDSVNSLHIPENVEILSIFAL